LARKILLADDSVTAQNMGRKILADAGYDVVTVNNGSAALKRIHEIRPDLIVLDVYMPGYSGLEVCQRIKESEETSHIPVLLTVGKLEPFKPEEARRVRADAHIVKPFEASELLTAITKLEDRMVPQAETSRFSSSSAGIERFSGESSGAGVGGRKAESKTEVDNGWKNRLRFPSKKKKEEPEPEDVAAAAGATFKDFKKGKGKNGASGVFAVNAGAPEPAVVPDIPRDITPDELDALSAVAAKLDGQADASMPEEYARLVEKKVEEPAAAVKPEEINSAPVPAAETKSEVAAKAAPAVEPEVAEAEAATIARDPVGETKEIVAEVGATAAEAAEAPQAEVVAAEAEVAKAQSADMAAANTPEVSADASGNAAPQHDEPAVAATMEVKAEVSAAASEAPVDTIESKPEIAEIEAVPEAAKPAEIRVAEEAAPSDAELTEALRLLTPATGAAGPSNGNAAHSQLLSDEVNEKISGPRWIAHSEALSAEEAAISLEAEMFRTFASAPAGGGADRSTGVSAIAAAVENRLASSGMAMPEENSRIEPRGQSIENAAAEAAAALEASAELLAAAASATPMVEMIKAEVERKMTAEPAAAEEIEKMGTEAKTAEETSPEESGPATFADAISQGAMEVPDQRNTGSEVLTAEAAHQFSGQSQDSSTEVGGQDSMKDRKSKSDKQNSQQGELQKAESASAENEREVKAAEEEAPKAMAAAADGSASSSDSKAASDAKTIANIVDSVMADLRPRIVEEIARKLSKK
jgi:CheY-like chemotaxis protein